MGSPEIAEEACHQGNSPNSLIRNPNLLAATWVEILKIAQ